MEREKEQISLSLIAPCPLPQRPLVPLWLPSLPSRPLTATATPRGAGDAPAGLGWARVLVATLGPCLGLLPSRSYSVPHDPSGAAWRRGGGQPGELGTTSKVWWSGRPLPLGWGQGPDTRLPPPSPSQVPSRGGCRLLPTLLGNRSREASASAPKASRLPCVCAHTCECVRLGVAEGVRAQRVPVWRAVPCEGCVRAQGACVSAQPPFQRKPGALLPPDLPSVPPALPEPHGA